MILQHTNLTARTWSVVVVCVFFVLCLFIEYEYARTRVIAHISRFSNNFMKKDNITLFQIPFPIIPAESLLDLFVAVVSSSSLPVCSFFVSLNFICDLISEDLLFPFKNFAWLHVHARIVSPCVLYTFLILSFPSRFRATFVTLLKIVSVSNTSCF